METKITSKIMSSDHIIKSFMDITVSGKDIVITIALSPDDLKKLKKNKDLTVE